MLKRLWYNNNKTNLSLISQEWDSAAKVEKKREILFYHGDILKGDLHIFNIMNDIAGAYENRGYELSNVEVIRQPRQKKMEFDDENGEGSL